MIAQYHENIRLSKISDFDKITKKKKKKKIFIKTKNKH